MILPGQAGQAQRKPVLQARSSGWLANPSLPSASKNKTITVDNPQNWVYRSDDGVEVSEHKKRRIGLKLLRRITVCIDDAAKLVPAGGTTPSEHPVDVEF